VTARDVSALRDRQQSHGEEAVATTSYSFDKARTLSGIAEGVTDFVDRFVKPMIEIHKSVCGPESLPKLFAGYDLARLFDQHGQDLERLFLKAYLKTTLTQFASTKIELKNPKTEPPAKLIVCPHGRVEPGPRRSVPPGVAFA
jgi:hypothetical protein